MSATASQPVVRVWSWLIPVVALSLLVAGALLPVDAMIAIPASIALMASVIAAVHHAEMVALRVGEPFGTIVLAVAVTIIEASLILTLTLAGTKESAVIPRDTIFSVVMIICNGVVGLCIVVGAFTHRTQTFNVNGSSPALAALIVLSAFALVLPEYTVTTPGGTYSRSQLAFVAVTSVVIWAVYIFVQIFRHRDYFLPADDDAGIDGHAAPPTARVAMISFGLLLLSLIAVVGLAKILSPGIERAIVAVGAPSAVLGVIIALLVLLPETWAAVRAAHANRLQTSMNLALGSALASIGLTIPVVAIASIVMDFPLVLAISPKDLVMLTLTFLVSAVTLAAGRTHIMHGAIHLVIFAAFLFLALVP